MPSRQPTFIDNHLFTSQRGGGKERMEAKLLFGRSDAGMEYEDGLVAFSSLPQKTKTCMTEITWSN